MSCRTNESFGQGIHQKKQQEKEAAGTCGQLTGIDFKRR
jgi:hypothetical protein